jgi:Cu(I)/Ag(I) efflux system protein CusF
MKPIATLSLFLALAASAPVMAESGGMKGMDMKGMDMKNMPMEHSDASANAVIHKATGTVKAVDPVKGSVTLAHGPVKTLNWPAMTMTFAVKDKRFFDKLAVGKSVSIDFVKQDKDYVVTAVK